MPPPKLAELPEMVLFSAVRVPLTLDTPPPVLSEMVLFAIVRAPLLDTPSPALPEMMLFWIVRAPPKELDMPTDPPLRITLRSVRFPGVGGEGELPLTAMRPKAGAFPSRAMMAPFPSIVIRLVIGGSPTGWQNGPYMLQ